MERRWSFQTIFGGVAQLVNFGTYNCLIWAGFAAGGPDVLALIAAEVKMPRKTLGLLLNVPISEYTCSILVVFFLELSYSF